MAAPQSARSQKASLLGAPLPTATHYPVTAAVVLLSMESFIPGQNKGGFAWLFAKVCITKHDLSVELLFGLC